MPVKVKAPHETTVSMPPDAISHHHLTSQRPPKKPKNNTQKFLVILGIAFIAILVIVLVITG